MDNCFCFNPSSFPAVDAEKGKLYLTDIFKGVASFCTLDNKVVLYTDTELKHLEISANFTFQDYQEYLKTINDMDLAVFVYDIEDKSPFLNKIPDNNIFELMNYNIKLFDGPIVGSCADILKYACLQGHVLISLPTAPCWETNCIPVTLINTQNRYDIEDIELLNIFNSNIAQLIPCNDWREEYENVIFTNEFNQWYDGLREKDKVHVIHLLKRAHSLNFKGTIEQTKSLDDSAEKLWEWRGGSPQFGKGRIRVLYKSQTGKHYILWGFIKRGFVNDIYDKEIKIAENAWNKLGV
jgi:hypothetical protein